MIAPAVVARLEGQLDALATILDGAAPAALEARPAAGEWSARENLAHLARHHAVFLERLESMQREDRPRLGRYRAEDDPEWPAWIGLPVDEIVARLRATRGRVIERLRGLSAADARRTGRHPVLGEVDVTRFVEFMLLHEAHHLYGVMIALGLARRAAR